MDDGSGDDTSDTEARNRRVDSGGRATTTIPRPSERRASDEGRSRLGDLRRRRDRADRADRADRIAPRRRAAWLFGIAALVVAGAIAAALFGLPVRTWFAQDDQLARLRNELDELSAVNNDLEDEVARLQTDDGIREAVRDELGHIANGERRESLQALPPLPRDLLDGWPYSQVANIITIRTAEHQAQAAATSTIAAPAPSTSVGAAGVGATTNVAATSTTPISAPGLPAVTGVLSTAITTTTAVP